MDAAKGPPTSDQELFTASENAALTGVRTAADAPANVYGASRQQ